MLEFILIANVHPFYDAQRNLYKLQDANGKIFWLDGDDFAEARQQMVKSFLDQVVSEYVKSGLSQEEAEAKVNNDPKVLEDAENKADIDILTVWDADMQGIFPDEAEA